MTNKIQEILDRAKDVAQGASNAVAGNVSAPVDGIAWLMRKAGIPVGDAPFGGSEWMAQKGLTAKPQNRLAELTGEFLGMAGPMAIGAKAPQIANKLLQASDNLNAPNRLAGPMAKQQGMFAGHLAKDAPVWKLEQAKTMQAQGIPDEQIYAKTGWFGGMPDKQWRYEIPDNAATFDLKSAPVDAWGAQEMPIYNALKHPQLQAAYPELGNTRVMHFPDEEFRGGQFNPQEMEMTLGHDALALGKSVPLHEMQHAIQSREGFALGGSANDFTIAGQFPQFSQVGNPQAIFQRKLDQLNAQSTAYINTLNAERKAGKLTTAEMFQKSQAYAKEIGLTDYMDAARYAKNPEKAYNNLAGEAEARLVQSRMNMTPEQRAASYPPSMFDVPAADQIVRFK